MADQFMDLDELPDFNSLYPDLTDLSILGHEENPFAIYCNDQQPSLAERLEDTSIFVDYIPDDLAQFLMDTETVPCTEACYGDKSLTDQETVEMLSEGVASPGESTSSATSSEAGDGLVAIPVQDLLDLLTATPNITSPPGLIPVSPSQTTSIQNLHLQHSVVSEAQQSFIAGKRKHESCSEHQPKKWSKTSPDVTTTDREKQKRNNLASKKTRATRKQKELELCRKEKYLVKSNAELKAHIQELTKEIGAIRMALVQRLDGK